MKIIKRGGRKKRKIGLIRTFLNRILDGTHNHYSCFLPGNVKSLPGLAVKRLFSGVTLSEAQTSFLRNLPEDAAVVYATKYKNSFECLFYHTRYQAEGFLYPEIWLDYKIFLWQPVLRIFKFIVAGIDYFAAMKALPDPYKSGYVGRELLNGRTCILSLIEKKGFYRRFVKKRTDPVQYLLDLQKSTERPIYIVPHLMFFSKIPPRSTPKLFDVLLGNEERPGNIKKIVSLFKNPGKIFVELSDPVNLKEFMSERRDRNESSELKSIMLRRMLLKIFNDHRQTITGPVLKSKAELKENILTGERLRAFLTDHSKSYDLPMSQALKKAEEHLNEIAANYKKTTIKAGNVIVKWLLENIFEGITINTEVLEKAKKMSRKGPLILVPCHKSHIDYLMVSYILHMNNMPCPHIAAGVNLAFWPLGPFFRTGGAFFLRRTFKGDALYSKVFAEYIHKLLSEGFNIEFFIEGGRSRTGKLLTPKLGFLSILFNSYKNGACDDLIFVPVFIGYDKVPEEKSYVHEIEGGEKKSENLLQVIKARKFLKKKYGRIYIKFNDPLSLKGFLSDKNLSLGKMKRREFHSFCKDFGQGILNSIDRMTIVTPHALVAAALLNCEKKRFSNRRFQKQIETYMDYLEARKIALSETLMSNPSHAVEKAFDEYVERKIVERHESDEDSGQSRLSVNAGKRALLDYYKNNCISYFIPAAYTALAILAQDSFQFFAAAMNEEYDFLDTLFQSEFSRDTENSAESLTGKNMRIFVAAAIVMPHPSIPDTYNITSEGFRKLKFFAGFAMTYLESYLIVLKYLARSPRKMQEKKELAKKISAFGKRLYKAGQIERIESISDMNCKNALAFFNSQGINNSGNSEKIEFYEKKIRMHIELI